MAGWLDRGFQRNTAGLLDPQMDPETLGVLRSQYKRAAIADMVGSISGKNPGYLNQTLGGFEGLLGQAEKQRELEQQKAARDMTLQYLGTAPDMDANQRALLATMTHAQGPDKALEFLTGRTQGGAATQMLDNFGNVIAAVPTADEQKIAGLLNAREQYPEGSATRRVYDQMLEKLTTNQPGVSVNVGGPSGPQFGSIPPGHVLNQTQDGGFVMAPIPGSPASREIEADQRAQELRQMQTARAGGTVVQDVNRALSVLDNVGPFGAGTGAAVGLRFPESDASTIQQLIESVQSNIGFDQLSQMRQASTTGGALGNVTELQLKQLQSVLGGLDVRGRPEMLQDNLKRVHNIYMDIIHGTPEQIAAIARERGLPPADVAPLMFRHQLSFDEYGNPVGDAGRTGRSGRGSGSPPPASAPADAGGAVRRWNPQTQRLE